MIIGQIFEREMAGHSPRSLGFGVMESRRLVYRNIERVEKPTDNKPTVFCDSD
jgi:hypothetical protein